MTISTILLLPTAAIFLAVMTSLPSVIEGGPGPSPPEGQVLDEVSPLYILPEESPPDVGGIPPEVEEEWPVDQSSSRDSPDFGITPNHIGCHITLETEQSCYDWSGKGYIKVILSNCNPKAADWIAIFESSDNEIGWDKGFGYWGHSYDWQYTCGNRYCSDRIWFTYNYFDQWWYKVPNGEYKIFLFADNGYRVKASSRTFVVRNEYGYCDGCASSDPSADHPTYYPTATPTEEPACSDSREDFNTKKYGWKNCDWVAKKPMRRCKCRLKGPGRKKTKDECPKTCDNCSVLPTQSPTVPPTANPTASPTRDPTPAPTKKPTRKPTKKPTRKPRTRKPTGYPTLAPTQTFAPTETQEPTETQAPTTFLPTTFLPTTFLPTERS